MPSSIYFPFSVIPSSFLLNFKPKFSKKSIYVFISNSHYTHHTVLAEIPNTVNFNDYFLVLNSNSQGYLVLYTYICISTLIEILVCCVWGNTSSYFTGIPYPSRLFFFSSFSQHKMLECP